MDRSREHLDGGGQYGQREPTGLARYDDERVHRRDWTAQRSAYAAFTGLLLGSAVGLLGNGLVSSAERTVEGLSVRYERFARRTAGTELVIRLAAAPGDMTEVRLSEDLARSVQVRDGGTLPVAQKTEGADAVYAYATVSGEPAELHVRLRYREAGPVSGEVVVDGRAVPLWTLVYP